MSKSIEINVPDIGDFAEVPVIEVLVAPGDSVATVSARSMCSPSTKTEYAATSPMPAGTPLQGPATG